MSETGRIVCVLAETTKFNCLAEVIFFIQKSCHHKKLMSTKINKPN